MKTICFFASFGNLKKLPGGGGETAARRLLGVLKQLGYDVHIFNRHRKYFENRLLDRMSMATFVMIDPILYFFFLLFRKKRNAATLYMGYAGSILRFDYLITKVTSILGFRNIMYLAGGKARWAYEKGAPNYQKLFEKMMQMYDEVMTEGYENMALIKSVAPHTKTFYLPNYTENGFAPSELPKRTHDEINIFYFGRIDAEKNVLLSIAVFNELCKKYNNMHLTIVGGGNSEYIKRVEQAIANSPYKDRITKEGRSSHERICEIMKSQHFFIFPSNEPCEGHSNAMNEAMSWGLVPVVSSNNFLPSIVGDERLVAKDFEVQSFVRIFEEIIDNNMIDELSRKMYDRVKENFTQSVVERSLAQELNQFFNITQ